MGSASKVVRQGMQSDRLGCQLLFNELKTHWRILNREVTGYVYTGSLWLLVESVLKEGKGRVRRTTG